MKTILLTFDIEEFPAKEFNIPLKESEAYQIGYNGTKIILKILKENKIVATCFVTYEFALKYKNLIQELKSIGCEIASHGYNHNHRYNKMSEKESLNYLKKARFGMKKLGFDVKGFRAPQMSKPKNKIIKKAGFAYDSSLHPTWIPGYYNNFFESRKIIEEEIVVVPLSVSPIIKAPMAWLWFRNFGLTYEKLLTKLNFLDMNFTNIYFHPWEFMNLEKFNKYLSLLIRRNTGEKFEAMLEDYIIWCKSKNYKFATITSYLKENEI